MNIFDEIDGFELVDPKSLEEFKKEMEEKVIPELVEKRRSRIWPQGWYCGNCHNYHGPHIRTCPEPPRNGSLRERLKEARQ